MNPKFIKSDNVTVCIVTFKGELFKGIARCNTTDKFDDEFGEKLSKLRADLAAAESFLNEIRFAKGISMLVPSKFSNRWHKESLEAEERQENRVRTLKTRIKKLLNGTEN